MSDYNGFLNSTTLPGLNTDGTVTPTSEIQYVKDCLSLVKSELFDPQIAKDEKIIQSIADIIVTSSESAHLGRCVTYFFGPEYVTPHSPDLDKIILWNVLVTLVEESSSDMLITTESVNLYDWLSMTKNNFLTQLFARQIVELKSPQLAQAVNYGFITFLNTQIAILQNARVTRFPLYQRNVVLSVYSKAVEDIVKYKLVD